MELNHIHTQRLLAFIASIIFTLITYGSIKLLQDGTIGLILIPISLYLLAFSIFGKEETEHES